MAFKAAKSKGWRARWFEIIFGHETRDGKLFDMVLLIAILVSLVCIIMESVESLRLRYLDTFRYLEWFFTALFTIEYFMRLMVVKRKRSYVLSFYGIVDLLSILPTYLAMVLTGAHYFMAIRSFRLIRIFRILKMVRFLGEAKVLSSALRASRIKITVFIIVVLCIVFIMGTVMYVVEGPENGFTSIPVSIYWCIVTLTTVGYGDIAPHTTLGQVIASVIMIMGYGIIAVPTGIVTSEMAKAQRSAPEQNTDRSCGQCGAEGLSDDAQYCKNCGNQLDG